MVLMAAFAWHRLPHRPFELAWTWRRPELGRVKHSAQERQNDMKHYPLALILSGLLMLSHAFGGSPNGRAGVMDAFYDGDLFTINFKEQSDKSAQALIAHNKSINFIYMSDDGLPGGEPFVSVIDAIQGDGFNPLWVEVQIHFTAGHTPRQLTGDEEIEDAVDAGEITLEVTDEVYRCSVIGPHL
jgi:hypothetical protein